ncbi:MAG: hypothetical protein IPO42_06940 [Chitinophagaceae bacterium]|nr:hypothetical protein [Chitinophagaceae bacterium]MBK9531518.1 hypothetical protein [Chitinophagaceae bacterium]
MSQMKVVGEYYFRKTEMVAGFNFSADGTFRFFFSYGAVDRNASGTFQADGDTLRLTSDKVAGRDFTITSQEKKGKGYSIVFSHPNKYLLTNIRCQFFTDGKMEDAFSDPEGKIHIDLAHCDSIYVQHLLYPDIATLVKDAANENNSFTLTLNDTMEQVSFKGIDFKIENDKTISCMPNYLLPMKDIKFVKH